VAREAVARGYSVAVVERGDWAGGTSSRSSKLFHGGFRYLRDGRLRFVREALRERDHHLRHAPDLVRRVRFRIRTGSGGPPTWLVRAGVAAYDLLSAGSSHGRPLAGEPSYEDAVTDDARFCLALLAAARREGTVAAMNRVAWEAWLPGEDRSPGARVTDLLTGRTGEVRARTLVNATGPWSGNVVSGPDRLRLTRGTHVVLRGKGDGDARLFFSPRDGRALLLIPIHDDVWLLGTTELDEPAPAADPVPRHEEIRYLADAFRREFPEWADWRPVGWQCGLRPLLAAQGNPSSLGREEKIVTDPATGAVSILGGKYTSYRVVAGEVVDRLEAVLGPPSAAPGAADLPAPPPAGSDAECVERAFSREDAVTPEDVLFRRTFWGHCGEVDKTRLAAVIEGWIRRWDLPASTAVAETERIRNLLARRNDVLAPWGEESPPGPVTPFAGTVG